MNHLPAAMLTTEFNLDSADDFYAALIDAHRDLTLAQSHELNAKLVLLLANHIGTLGEPAPELTMERP